MGGFLYSNIPNAGFRNIYLGLPALVLHRKVFDVCLVHKVCSNLVGCDYEII